MNKELLIIFTESPLQVLSSKKQNIHSRVDVYKKAFRHCCLITKELKKEKYIFSDQEIIGDYIQPHEARKFLKLGSDNGEEMLNAFLKGFIKNHTHIILIKSVTFEISSEIVEDAFKKLETFDYAFGPLKDKSFYLLGMKKLNPFIFEKTIINNKEAVINEFKERKENYYQLPELKEITEMDNSVLNFSD
jgi:uncharacterized protein